jgi:hypothetical protein
MLPIIWNLTLGVCGEQSESDSTPLLGAFKMRTSSATLKRLPTEPLNQSFQAF